MTKKMDKLVAELIELINKEENPTVEAERVIRIIAYDCTSGLYEALGLFDEAKRVFRDIVMEEETTEKPKELDEQKTKQTRELRYIG